MVTLGFITELFCRIDSVLHEGPVHVQAHLYFRELVTMALLRALNGVGNRAFYRWLDQNYAHCFRACLSTPACPGCLSLINPG